MMCQQCEDAPCEVVCPVAATVHEQRGPQRHGLQPVRGHPLTCANNLPLQGCAGSTFLLYFDYEHRRAWRLARNPTSRLRQAARA